MKTFPWTFVIAAAAGWFVTPGLAEEKSGLSLTVGKTVIENNDTRTSGYYYDRINRVQGLKATIKNLTFKEMPEGEIAWVILVRKYATETIESFQGVEKLKALKPAETIAPVFGNATVGGYKDLGAQDKDKVEWQVVIRQGGKEMIKLQSTSGFDSLAKRAVKGTPPAKAAP